MVLSTFVISRVTPRGGSPGTVVSVTGSGFGVVAGTVTFDPFGVNIAATITLWQDDLVEFTVPYNLVVDQFSTLFLQRSDGNDGGSVPFWVPVANPLVQSDDLDYQYPAFEEGDEQDEDNPRIMSAADMNRMLNRVQALIASVNKKVDPKDSVIAATITNIAGSYSAVGGASKRGQLTAMPDVVDTVALVVGDRVLLKDQIAQAQNGIWVVTTLGTGVDGVWDRAEDFDEDSEVTNGAFVFVTGGATNTTTGWVLITADPITVGGVSGSSLVWQQTGVTLSLPTTANKGENPSATSGDGSATGIMISTEPLGYVQVMINGFKASLGDGIKTKHSYFSADGGTTARSISGIVAGDELIWNGAIAGVELVVTDRVDLDYVVA